MLNCLIDRLELLVEALLYQYVLWAINQAKRLLLYFFEKGFNKQCVLCKNF